jgi:hypothetical protein
LRDSMARDVEHVFDTHLRQVLVFNDHKRLRRRHEPVLLASSGSAPAALS